MPTVSVYEDELREHLEEHFTPETFQDLCFQFGLELDDVTSEYEMTRKEQGESAAQGKSKRTIYRVDIPANRYDLLCVEGLVLALKVFRKKMEVPVLKLSPEKPTAQMHITAETSKIRPFVVCAILRGVKFDKARYESFIELQDKLHQNICRRRGLASVGTHDLDTIEGPFTYDALPPEKIVFKPLKAQVTVDSMAVGLVVSRLNETKELGKISAVDKAACTCKVGSETITADKNGNFELEIFKINAKELMAFYSTHQQLKQYLHLIRDSPVYPVVLDKQKRVCSLPPIINGDHSKITLDTKNVFIEVTATDLTKSKIVLNTLVAMFSQYCTKPFTCESVEHIYAKGHSKLNGQTKVFPDLSMRPMTSNATRLKTDLNLPHLSTQDVINFLNQMSLVASADTTKGKPEGELVVNVPVTRSDVMHECDLVEDVAIAYGYNNLKHELPQVVCPGQEYGINHFSDLVRGELANAGFCEALNFGLLSFKDTFTKMRRAPGAKPAATSHAYDFAPVPVKLSNPKTKEFEIVRTALLPGVLNTVFNNKKNAPPIKLFEVSDVVVQDTSKETFSRNVRRACCVFAGLTSGFENVHGALDHLLSKLQCKPAFDAGKSKLTYTLEPLGDKDPAFLPGRSAALVVKGVTIGVLGVLHPEVCEAFELPFACAAFELNLEPFLGWL